jgi:hypothetical protein
MFFNDAFSLLRMVIVGTLAYLSLGLLLRVSGKRTLSMQGYLLRLFELVIMTPVCSWSSHKPQLCSAEKNER